MCRLLFSAIICGAAVWYTPAAAAQPPVVAASVPAVAYHRQVQHLEAQIRWQRARIDVLERTLAEWQSLDRFRGSRVLGLDIERTRLALVEAEHTLACLRQQQFDLTRTRALGW